MKPQGFFLAVANCEARFLSDQVNKRDHKVKFSFRFGMNPNLKIAALNAPRDASPIVRPEGAQGSTSLSGRSQIWRDQYPGRCPGLASSAPLPRQSRKISMADFQNKNFSQDIRSLQCVVR